MGIFDSKKPSAEQPKKPSQVKQWISRILLGGVVLSGAPKEVKAETPKKPDATLQEGESFTSKDRSLTMPGVEITFLKQNPDGSHTFNPWALLAPVMLDLGIKEDINEGQIKISNNAYARFFNSGKPINKEDYKKIAGQIEQKIRQVIGNELIGLDFTKEAHGQAGENQTRITSIVFEGTASPEGPAAKGSKTLEEGAVDTENIKLAGLRGRTASNILRKDLGKLGIDQAQIKVAGGEELQFSKEEFKQLTELASGYHGKDNMEKIFTMIQRYNDGKINNPKIKALMDQLVASKRSVKITINFEGQHEKHILIPIPIFLLFLLRRRKPKEFRIDDSWPPIEEGKEPPAGEEVPPPQDEDQIPPGRVRLAHRRPAIKYNVPQDTRRPDQRNIVSRQRALGASSEMGIGRGPHRQRPVSKKRSSSNRAMQ